MYMESKYQQCDEKPCCSLLRSNSSRDLGFMNQPELLNVATSRQLMKLIIVGDGAETFEGGCRTSGRIYDFVASHGHSIIMS
jgi:hypothetical protein